MNLKEIETLFNEKGEESFDPKVYSIWIIYRRMKMKF